MAERLAAVVRAAAREGQFMISEEMLSLAGATREQMDGILIDLSYRKIDEKPAEDPENRRGDLCPAGTSAAAKAG